MTDNNLTIWNAVSTTDPDHTKQVNQRGGYTAIDANYQFMNATRQFGPIGVGWGFVTALPIFHDKFVIVPLTFWHSDRENTFGPFYGCSEMLGNRPDSDAPKKATTDGITKALSMLGFNADVFLGKFDDQKYVDGLKDEKKAADRDPRTIVDALIDSVKKRETMPALMTWLKNDKFTAPERWLAETKPAMSAELDAVIATQKQDLDPAAQAPIDDTIPY